MRYNVDAESPIDKEIHDTASRYAQELKIKY